MHFAGPPRKTSHPPPYAFKASRSPLLRRSRLQLLGTIAFGALVFFFILSRLSGSGSDTIPAGTPAVVIVTTINQDLGEEYNEAVRQNRKDYAAKHGYETFLPSDRDYDIGNVPRSWARIPALRHAMTVFPHSAYFFYLDHRALIMNPSFRIEEHIMDRKRLEDLMITDVPVVPPDSVIKTFSHLKGDRIDLVLTQDKEGLLHNSFIIRRGEWAKYFLDAWFDPLYRSYNFQKSEQHALEHIVQWHGTILAKLALVPQRIMSSSVKDRSGHNTGGVYNEGDFIVTFDGCDKHKAATCEEDMAPFLRKLQGEGEDGG